MTRIAIGFIVLMLVPFAVSAQTMKPSSPVVSQADGFAIIPNAAFPPDKKRIYRAVYDSTKFARDPSMLVPALNNAGSVPVFRSLTRSSRLFFTVHPSMEFWTTSITKQSSALRTLT